MRLCLAAGVLDVDAVAQTLPDRVLSQWMAFDAIDPLEDRRMDCRIGLLACALENVLTRGQGRLDPTLFSLHSDADDIDPETGEPTLELQDWRIGRARLEQAIG